MSIEFSQQPGAHERQLRRKYHNPLFPDAQKINAAQVEQARQQDQAELKQFLRDFRALVEETMELQPNAESDVILDIKERLDQCYIHCCALPGDQSEIKTAVNKLVAVIMKAVRQGAANDPVALNKLDEEDVARQMHNRLAEQALVADLLLPDSPITEDELVPCLLSESETALAAALQLFELEQLSAIHQNAKQLLLELEQQGQSLPQAQQRLKQIEIAMAQATPDFTVN